jgi:hypothetical protein
MTPPLMLRDEEGNRSIIEVDDAFFCSVLQQSPRVTAFLRFAPGVIVEVKSRCLNKRRVPVLCVRPVAAVEPSRAPVLGTAFRELADRAEKKAVAL